MLGPVRLKILTHTLFQASFASQNQPCNSLFCRTFTIKSFGCTNLAENAFIPMKRRNLQGGGEGVYRRYSVLFPPSREVQKHRNPR